MSNQSIDQKKNDGVEERQVEQRELKGAVVGGTFEQRSSSSLSKNHRAADQFFDKKKKENSSGTFPAGPLLGKSGPSETGKTVVPLARGSRFDPPPRGPLRPSGSLAKWFPHFVIECGRASTLPLVYRRRWALENYSSVVIKKKKAKQ